MTSPVVMLVDDEAFILSALRRTLRKEGFELVIAETPSEALQILGERTVDVVVSDQKMPEMNGIDLLREIAARSPHTRRVLLTGWPEMLTRAELDAAGVDAVLPKPWEDPELKSTLQRLAAGRDSGSDR